MVSKAATLDWCSRLLIVATCGLSAVLGSQVARQSWEIGVLRAIGARDRDVIWVLMTEALCAAIAGALLALPVAAVTTVALIQLIHLATGLPMPTTISFLAPVVWTHRGSRLRGGCEHRTVRPRASPDCARSLGRVGGESRMPDIRRAAPVWMRDIA